MVCSDDTKGPIVHSVINRDDGFEYIRLWWRDTPKLVNYCRYYIEFPPTYSYHTENCQPRGLVGFDTYTTAMRKFQRQKRLQQIVPLRFSVPTISVHIIIIIRGSIRTSLTSVHSAFCLNGPRGTLLPSNRSIPLIGSVRFIAHLKGNFQLVFVYDYTIIDFVCPIDRWSRAISYFIYTFIIIVISI